MTEHLPLTIRDPDDRRTEAALAIEHDLHVDGPLVSCLMVSRGHRFPAIHAIDCFRRQTYANRELVIVSAGPDCAVERLVDEIADPAIRFVRAAPQSLGELRNVSAAHAQGELACQWDDDDLSAPDRIAVMMAVIARTQAQACFLRRIMLWWPARRRIARSSARIWENTMLVRRGALPIYPAIGVSEDTALARMIVDHHRIAMIDAPTRYCYIFHGANQWHEGHFEALFAAGEESANYADTIAGLGTALPLADYAGDLAGA